ncbi:MAG: GatB/YqeY domain-containing protein [Chloroflexi bacterium]|nr:GatB/YqeY domain-containing protein [Chloroflexota bacterium]
MGKLREDLKAALRRGDKPRLAALRAVISAVTYAEKDKGKSQQTEDILLLVAREARQRKESIEAFAKAGRQDLVDKEKAELAVLTEYLPQQLTRGEITALAQKVIAETGARGPGDKGKVMGKLMPQVKGKAEGQVVNEVVSGLLQGK